MSALEPEATVPEPPARRRNRRLVVVTGIAVLVGVALVTASVGVNSDAGCALCHASQADALTQTAHAGVTCAACHAASPRQVSARLDVVFRMVPRSITGVRLASAGRPIGRRACLDCHGAVLAEGKVMAGDGLRIEHAACADGALCAGCHSVSSHGTSTRVVRSAAMADCTGCHLTVGASTACDTCHEGNMPSDRVRDPVWVRTHGPDWKELHGLGDLRTCAVCHAGTDCEDCHGAGVPHPTDFGGTHGSYAIESGTGGCLTCHESASWCANCHRVDMPHPDGFLQEHSGVAVGQEDPACTRCHPAEDCKTCHGFHVHPGGTRPPVGKYGGS